MVTQFHYIFPKYWSVMLGNLNRYFKNKAKQKNRYLTVQKIDAKGGWRPSYSTFDFSITDCVLRWEPQAREIYFPPSDKLFDSHFFPPILWNQHDLWQEDVSNLVIHRVNHKDSILWSCGTLFMKVVLTQWGRVRLSRFRYYFQNSLTEWGSYPEYLFPYLKKGPLC